MNGGSPYGYRRWAQEIPSLVIAMRESTAPSPPVSQSAAITSSAKEQQLAAAHRRITHLEQATGQRSGDASDPGAGHP